MTILTERPGQVDAGPEQARRQINALTVAVILLTVAVFGLGAWMVYQWAVPEGTIQVTVDGIEGAKGGQLVGVLYTGATEEQNAIGGFKVTVDDDPFSTTQTIRQPGSGKGIVFAPVGKDVLIAEPGTYSLALYHASGLIRQGWGGPTGPLDLVGCRTTFELDARERVAMTVTGGFGDTFRLPRCTVAP